MKLFGFGGEVEGSVPRYQSTIAVDVGAVYGLSDSGTDNEITGNFVNMLICSLLLLLFSFFLTNTILSLCRSLAS